jgi:hypothetical protein
MKKEAGQEVEEVRDEDKYSVIAKIKHDHFDETH